MRKLQLGGSFHGWICHWLLMRYKPHHRRNLSGAMHPKCHQLPSGQVARGIFALIVSSARRLVPHPHAVQYPRGELGFSLGHARHASRRAWYWSSGTSPSRTRDASALIQLTALASGPGVAGSSGHGWSPSRSTVLKPWAKSSCITLTPTGVPSRRVSWYLPQLIRTPA